MHRWHRWLCTIMEIGLIILGMYLAVPGFLRMLEMYQNAGSSEYAMYNLVSLWIIFSLVMVSFAYMFVKFANWSIQLIFVLFLMPIFVLGYLAYESMFLLYLGAWLVPVVLSKFPRMKGGEQFADLGEADKSSQPENYSPL